MKSYQKYLIVILMILIISIVYFYLQNKQIAQEKTKAFNFAYTLSQNEKLKKAIQNKNSTEGYDILKQYMSTLETFSGSKIHAQIVSKDFVIFARSWDNRDAGLHIKDYRPDLKDMIHTLKPHLSFVAARRLVLIASIPIVKDSKFIGFVEVIEGFDSIQKYFSNYDVDLLVLLDSKYKKQAVLLKDKPHIFNTIVANDTANVHHIAYLQKVGIKSLLSKGILEGENYFYFSKVILNSDGQNIGSFILILSKKKLKLFSAFEKELDTFFTYARKDLYYSIINSDSSIKICNGLTDKELLLLKNCVHNEDKIILEEKLRKRLKNHTKDELISLLLDVNSNKKSRGKIK
jgi:hypothetical protein